jgi:hypothetical protein
MTIEELIVGKVDPTLPRYGTDLIATRLSVSKVNVTLPRILRSWLPHPTVFE